MKTQGFKSFRVTFEQRFGAEHTFVEAQTEKDAVKRACAIYYGHSDARPEHVVVKAQEWAGVPAIPDKAR